MTPIYTRYTREDLIEMIHARDHLITDLKEDIERLRKALSQIAWMDEFLSADAAREMMNIARETLAGVVGDTHS